MNSKDLKRYLRLSTLANSEIYHLFRNYMKREKIEGDEEENRCGC